MTGGRRVHLRPLRPDDGPILAAGISRLSARSRYLRFQSARPALSARELAYLTDLDQRDRAGWLLAHGRVFVAVGRYARESPTGDLAEIALTVLDPWQGKGLARPLIAALMETARAAGIGRLGARIADDNPAARRLIEGLGLSPQWRDDGWWAELSTDPARLPDSPLGREIAGYCHQLARDAKGAPAP